MPNPYFHFKEFTVYHDRCAMKVTTDGCFFGAWCAALLGATGEKRALDIGAGSGLLSLMVAQKTRLQIDAVELDSEAAAQAAENVQASSWADRISVHECGIQAFSGNAPYDVIFSNPPFYENELQSIVRDRNVAHHDCGLRIVELVQQLSRLLAPEGDAYLLLPYKRREELIRLVEEAGFFIHRQVVVRSYASHPPFRLMLCLSKKKQENGTPENLHIYDAPNQYSEAFTALLKDYYLYL